MSIAPGHRLVPEGAAIFPTLTVHEHLVMAAGPGRDGQQTWNLQAVLDCFPA